MNGSPNWRLLLVLSLSLAFILSPRTSTPSRHYQVGDIARENVKATGEFLVEDVETTAKRQKELLAQTPPVFDLEEQMADKVQQRLQKAMDYMRRVSQENAAAARRPAAGARGKAKPAVPYKVFLEHKPEFDKLLGVSIPNPTFQLLAKAEFSPYLEAMTSQVLSQFFNQGVISSRTILQPAPKEILVRRLPSKKETLERPPFSFLELDEGRKSAAGYCRDVAVEFSPADRWLVCDLTQYLLVPNVSPNWAETQERQQASLKELQPVYFKVKRGEMLVREGEPITALHLVKLEAQSKLYPRSRAVLIFLGIFFCLTVLLAVFYQLASLSLRNFSQRLRDLAFLAALLLTGTLLNKFLLILGEHLSRNLPAVGLNLVYLLPLGLPAIFAAMFLGLETGVGVAFLSATFTALMVPQPFPLFLYFVIAGLVAVWGVKNCRRRNALIQAGLAISLANMVLLAAFKLLEYPFAFKDLLDRRGLRPRRRSAHRHPGPGPHPHHGGDLPLLLQHPPPGTPEPGPADAPGADAGRPGHLPPFPGGGPDGGGRGGDHRRQPHAGQGRGLLSRRRQDQKAGLFRGKPDGRGKQAREAGPLHEQPDPHLPRQGRGGTGPETPFGRGHRRHHPPAPRHQLHQLLLSTRPRPRRPIPTR